jgi:exopolysaccharide biosynthesis polyprenyl glycosylphosphotransferase
VTPQWTLAVVDAPTAAAAVSPATRPQWRGRYQRGVIAVDAIAAALGVAVALIGRFDDVGLLRSGVNPEFAVALPLVWLFCASLNRAYEQRFLGAGTIEFVRVGRAFLQLTAIVAFVAYVTKSDLSRSVSLAALLFTLVGSLLGRLTFRAVLHRRRRAGGAIVPVLAVGNPPDIAAFTDTLHRNRFAGFRFTGACVTSVDSAAELTNHDIPIFAGVDSIRAAVAESGAQTVAVLSSDVTGEKLRWIAWQLEGSDTDLVVLPGLTEVAGRRIDLQQVGGLPLLYVAQPEFEGVHRILKGGFDRIVSALLLVLSAPLLLGIAVLVRLTSRGHALYRQTRVGKDGKTFQMLKFRSMTVDADRLAVELQEANEVEGDVLFKMKMDPRVTRIGRVLRRYSLDELPQLLNVFAGSMSLVGPRPPLPSEVAKYGYDAQRRLLVKPGLTGLWQVSGRSDLTWEESVRLDLRYVENWSLALDIVLLARTFGAVLRPRGAY